MTSTQGQTACLRQTGEAAWRRSRKIKADPLKKIMIIYDIKIASGSIVFYNNIVYIM